MGRRRTFDEHEKSAFWAWWKNGKVQPTDVNYGCNDKFWFWCDNKECKHLFQATPKSVTAGSWCPYCRSTKLCSGEDCNFCFNKSFASCERAANWSSKNELTPRMVNKGTTDKYYFDCDECGHELYSNLRNVAKGKWCAYCYGTKICFNEDCHMCFKASFASHPFSEHWSKKNEKRPREVFRGIQEKFYFDCPCGHEIFMSLESLHKGYKCYYCCKRSRTLCGVEKCVFCFNRSIAATDLVDYWSKKNELKPWQVFPVTEDKYWFDCDCGHSFLVSPLGLKHHETWCGYCSSPPKHLCPKEIDCKQCFEKSFASSPRSKFWSKKNEKTPREVFKASGKKFWFDCDKNPDHEFEAALGSITCENTWCSLCKHKTEDKLHGILLSYYEIETQVRFPWAKTMPFDFKLKKHKVLIELDGDQHFEQVANWKSPEIHQERDAMKMKKAIEEGYSIIRIAWYDVYNDRNNWLERLLEAIESVKNNTSTSVIFICSRNEYDSFIDKYGTF